jgi:hypothetical protein
MFDICGSTSSGLRRSRDGCRVNATIDTEDVLLDITELTRPLADQEATLARVLAVLASLPHEPVEHNPRS